MFPCYQSHTGSMLPFLVSNKTFAGEIGFDIIDRFTQQFLKPLFIRFKTDTSMHEKSEVGPHFVDIVQLIPLDDHLHTHLDPGGYADHKTNIPLRCFFYNFFEFFIPVFLSRYFLPRFIKRLEPERRFFYGDAAQIAGIIPWPFLQIGTAAQCKPSFTDGAERNIFIGTQTQQLFDHDDLITPQQIIGDRDILTGRFAGTAAERIILDLTRPANV